MLILLEMDIIYQEKTFFCFDNNFLNLSEDLGTSAAQISTYLNFRSQSRPLYQLDSNTVKGESKNFCNKTWCCDLWGYFTTNIKHSFGYFE